MNARPLKLALAASLATATLLGSAGVLAALNGGGAVTLGPWRPLQIAAGYDRAADAALGRRDPASLARAAQLSRRAIALNPYDTAAWLRLASVDALQNQRLSPAGVAALKRAYDLVAIDPYVATWRLGFAMQHWGDLPAEVKTAVRTEAFALGGEQDHKSKVLDVLARVRNPQARVTASLWAASIEATVPRSPQGR
jgi:hypothetical protein